MLGTLKGVVLLLFIFELVSESVLGSRREFPTCRSRDNCIRLTHCASYMSLIKSLRKPLTRGAVLFLRKQECGFDGMYPMVCCFPTQTNIRRPQDNRFIALEENGFSTETPTYYVPNFPDAPRKKPDFTPVDLSDYRSFKDTKSLDLTDQVQAPESSIKTSTVKSTTQEIQTTTRMHRRKSNNKLNDSFNYMHQFPTPQPVRHNPDQEAKNKRAEELKRKMEAINNAFMYSTMDNFFVRRMDDDSKEVRGHREGYSLKRR